MSHEDRIHLTSIPDLLIGEQVRNEVQYGPSEGKYKSRDVAEGLTRQMPHRVYGGPNDTVLRALFHHDRVGQAVGIEVIRKYSEEKYIRLQFEVCNGNQSTLTALIERTRRRYGLSPKNIISEPDDVYVLQNDISEQYHFLHVGMGSNFPQIGYHYSLGPLGHRCIGLQVGRGITIPANAIKLFSPPDEMVRHGI